ncbi:hypothetical protein T07_7839 [Trichinella nelsoni]|uniref:Uncharacterized protein n=1 Tax=Trichinella nelsoni TaxID=6336 RepID=A0A0V0RGB5_9BILA|nr:hypothetical protein T07_7839 [Trichinella nelsoni]
MPVELVFGQMVSERQRCSDSVSQACQLPSSIEGIVFSADPHAELHLSLRNIGTHLRSTGMCCQTRSSTIANPRILNNCLTKLVWKQRDNGYLEFSKSRLEFLALRVLADVKLQIT